MFRWARRLAALALLGVVAYVGLTFTQVWRASRRDQARPAQAVVVLGAAQYNGRPSAVLRARLDHAASLYKRGYADTVVVTGGRQPGDRYTEASTSAAYLAQLGIPDSAVLREVSGRTSWQSLASAAAFLKRRGVHRVLLVSDGFHAARIVAIAHELGLKGYASPTRTSPIKGRQELGYMVRETFSVAAGRIVGFRRAAGIAGRARGVVGTG
jgi:vancomycin permeability regulator SanA